MPVPTVHDGVDPKASVPPANRSSVPPPEGETTDGVVICSAPLLSEAVATLGAAVDAPDTDTMMITLSASAACPNR